MEAALVGGADHGPEMVILRQSFRFVEDAVITGDMAIPIGPEQRHQADPLNDCMVFAGPVATNQCDIPGIGLVEVESSRTSTPSSLLTWEAASNQRFSGSGSSRRSKRVKASWAGAWG